MGNSKPRTAASLLIALLLLTGCRVGPDYCGPPAAPVAPSWENHGDETVRFVSPDLPGWWMQFEDPVLDALISEAISQNLDLKVAAERIFEARALRCTVRSDLFPQISKDASYTFSKFATNSSGMGGLMGAFGSTADQWHWGLGGSWEIDVFGRLHRLVEAADADIAVSVEDYRDTLIILMADVAINYVEARSYQQRLQIAHDNLGIQQRTLTFTQSRFKAQLGTELDVVQAQANAETTASEIPSLQAGYRQTLNRLSVLLGYPPGTVDEILAETAPVPKPPAELAVGIPAELLRQRPDIRRAEYELAAQTARIGAAVGELYPKFSITGSFGLDARDFARLFDANSIAANVGPSMQWNILNFGKFRCNVYVQESRQRQRCLLYQAAVLRAAEEVDNALVNYVRQKQRQTNLLQAVTANQRSVDLSQKRYIGGDVSFQRVLDSQRSLLQSQDQLALNEANITVSLIQVYRALGGGWEGAEAIAAGTMLLAEEVPMEEVVPTPDIQ